jgi:hypothetical protein
MKTRIITYWITTGLVSLMMAFSAVLYLSHTPAVVEGFAHLGYPAYFPNMLGVAKLLGVCALLAPHLPVLKEWAYAGFTFTFIAALVSHLESGESSKAAAPVIALALLGLSYFFRPASRRVTAK